MRSRPNLSPNQLATFAGLGGLISASGFLVPFSRVAHHPRSPWLLAATLGLILLGFAVSLLAESHLKTGVLAGRWNPGQIVSLRAVFASSLWTGASLLLLVASGIAMFAFPRHRNLGWALLLFGQTLTRLQAATKPPRAKPSAFPFSPHWQNFRPLRSDHWGER